MSVAIVAISPVVPGVPTDKTRPEHTSGAGIASHIKRRVSAACLRSCSTECKDFEEHQSRSVLGGPNTLKTRSRTSSGKSSSVRIGWTAGQPAAVGRVSETSMVVCTATCIGSSSLSGGAVRGPRAVPRLAFIVCVSRETGSLFHSVLKTVVFALGSKNVHQPWALAP